MMKYINIVTCLFISVLICSSCKEDTAYDFPGDGQNRVYFKTVDNTVNGYDKLSMEVLQTKGGVFAGELQMPVYTTKPADGDIYVSVQVNQEAVNDYNSDNATEYPLFPVTAVNIANNNLKIPSSTMQSEGAFSIVINSEKLGDIEAGTYLLPLTLSEVSGSAALSSNRSTIYLFVKLSVDEDNIWDVTPEDKGELFVDERINWKAEAFNSEFENASKIFDGDDNSTAYYYPANTEGEEEYGFIIDMQEKISNIAGIYEKFYWYRYAISESEIYTSLDNKEWTYQGKFLDSDEKSDIVFYNLVEARYIKILIKDSGKFSYRINEFNIYLKNN